MTMNILQQYIESLHEALLSKNDEKLKVHMRKWQIKIPESDEIFQIMKHKSITARVDLPEEMRRESKKWLFERKYESFDDGDV